MAQSITDQVGFLGDACREEQDLIESSNSLEKFHIEEKQLEKELEAEKKAVADAISLTVKRRLDELNSSYDKEIAKGQDRLKRVRSKREKAKSQGMKERIAEETAELQEENRDLNLQQKSLFQKDRVPRFCKSTLYYSLYFTRGFSEFLLLLFTIFICFLAIPFGIYTLIPQKSIYYLVGIYFITIVVFGGLYVFVNNRTKVRHQVALRKGRSIRDMRRSNNKKIHVITGSIRRDRDEKVYNLERFDDEIAQIELELTEITNKKKEALNTFEKVTKNIISDEIAGNSRQKIEELSSAVEMAADSVKRMEQRVKEQTLHITDTYESLIGKEFMVPERLDILADFIRSGKAATITEAETLYQNKG